MSSATEPREGKGEGEGVAERRAQTELTQRVGVTLERQGKTGKTSWSTWKRRFGIGADKPKA
jgi:hypothetical protein